MVLAEFNWAALIVAAVISLIVAAGKTHPVLGADSAQWFTKLGFSRGKWAAIGGGVAVSFILLTAWTLRNCG